jgi:hypothetical protein
MVRVTLRRAFSADEPMRRGGPPSPVARAHAATGGVFPRRSIASSASTAVTQTASRGEASLATPSCLSAHWNVMLETYWLMFQVASVSVWLVIALP